MAFLFQWNVLRFRVCIYLQFQSKFVWMFEKNKTCFRFSWTYIFKLIQFALFRFQFLIWLFSGTSIMSRLIGKWLDPHKSSWTDQFKSNSKEDLQSLDQWRNMNNCPEADTCVRCRLVCVAWDAMRYLQLVYFICY